MGKSSSALKKLRRKLESVEEDLSKEDVMKGKGGTNRNWIVSAETGAPPIELLDKRAQALLSSYTYAVGELVEAVRQGRAESYKKLKEKIDRTHKEMMAHIEMLERRL